MTFSFLEINELGNSTQPRGRSYIATQVEEGAAAAAFNGVPSPCVRCHRCVVCVRAHARLLAQKIKLGSLAVRGRCWCCRLARLAVWIRALGSLGKLHYCRVVSSSMFYSINRVKQRVLYF